MTTLTMIVIIQQDTYDSNDKIGDFTWNRRFIFSECLLANKSFVMRSQNQMKINTEHHFVMPISTFITLPCSSKHTRPKIMFKTFTKIAYNQGDAKAQAKEEK